ncbi:Facilitated trehalose transporter Tret1 [Melipona quadrifasciata]|uniref:Facilitated trehalose transporter Tret1 n=1 Tax=Melipona quadrifasciata TaxID=166423 RepID=A0A0N0U708_9HYME|nr:Facilitated trehalose transporter Tret1 [Melipona quadrifasciata]
MEQCKSTDTSNESEQEKIGMGEIVSCPRCKTCQHLPETSEDTVETELSSTIPAGEPIPESIIRDQRAAKKTARLRQWLASISATFCMVAVGTVYGWITISLPYLTSEDNTTLKLTSDEVAWLVSVTIIGSTIGPFMGASIADCYGRRFCLLVCNGFFILGWSFVLLATKVEILYVSRVILGMGVGIAYTTCPMYLSEVASTEIRGALGTLTAVNVFTGSLFTCCIGLWVSYTTLSSILLILPMIFIVIFIWFPESPYYLVAVDRRKKAYRSISYFKGITKRNELMAEMEYICKVLGKNSIKPSSNLNSQSWLDKMRLMKQPGNKKALCIVVGLTTAQQLSGNFSTMQYLELLFMKMKTIKSSVATIIVLAVGLLSGTAATVMVEIFGRRALLIISTLGLGITLGILTSYFALVQHISGSSTLDILAVTDIIFYQLFYQLGLGTLTNVLIGELFPTEAKSIAGAIVIMFDAEARSANVLNSSAEGFNPWPAIAPCLQGAQASTYRDSTCRDCSLWGADCSSVGRLQDCGWAELPGRPLCYTKDVEETGTSCTSGCPLRRKCNKLELSSLDIAGEQRETKVLYCLVGSSFGDRNALN